MKVFMTLVAVLIGWVGWQGSGYLDHQSSCSKAEKIPALASGEGVWPRSGSYPTCASGKWSRVKELKVLYPEGGVLATPPVVFPRGFLREPNGKSELPILAVRTTMGLILLDGENFSVLHDIKFPFIDGKNPSSYLSPGGMALDFERGAIWGALNTGWEKSTNWLWRIDLATRKMKWMRLEVGALFSGQKHGRDFLNEWGRCGTSVQFAKSQRGDYLAIGCGPEARIAPDGLGSLPPGARGGILLIENLDKPILRALPIAGLNSEGAEASSAEVSEFLLSSNGQNDFLVAAGGPGPMGADQRNFGCSYVRMDRVGGRWEPMGWILRPMVEGEVNRHLFCENSFRKPVAQWLGGLHLSDRLLLMFATQGGMIRGGNNLDPKFHYDVLEDRRWTKLNSSLSGAPRLWAHGEGALVAISGESDGNWRFHLLKSDLEGNLAHKHSYKYPGRLWGSPGSILYPPDESDEAIWAQITKPRNDVAEMLLIDVAGGGIVASVPMSGRWLASHPVAWNKKIWFVGPDLGIHQIELESSFVQGAFRPIRSLFRAAALTSGN